MRRVGFGVSSICEEVLDCTCVDIGELQSSYVLRVGMIWRGRGGGGGGEGEGGGGGGGAWEIRQGLRGKRAVL